MAAPPPTVLLVDADPASGLVAALAGCGLQVVRAVDAAAARQHDAVLYAAATAAALSALAGRPDLVQAAFDNAVLVLAEPADAALEDALLQQGVQAIVGRAEWPNLPRSLRHAQQRKQAERAARMAYATDLATGLPHRAQLLEHLTQLLALREREPAPMVLMVLRIDGVTGAATEFGAEAANILRRKVAVRLRSGLRASDVVAAIGPDTFGVLLGRLEAKADGERVAAKLVSALQQPISVAGQACRVGAAVGLALYPEHGRQAEALLQRAAAQAGTVAALGREGQTGLVERDGGKGGAAANDPA